MYVKGDMVYSEAYRYLRRKDAPVVCLQGQGAASAWNEVELELPLEVRTEHGDLVRIGDLLAVRVGRMEYGAVKRAVVGMRYSNDDQLALLLNRERDAECAALYGKMQEWRNFAAEVARAAVAASQGDSAAGEGPGNG